jgi:hypothetical protein
LGSERPIGLIERLVYRAPKNEGRTIHKCAPINTVVSVLHLQNCCLRIKVSFFCLGHWVEAGFCLVKVTLYSLGRERIKKGLDWDNHLVL